MRFNELVKLVMEKEESELERQRRIMHEKFPWVKKMEEKNSQILGSIIYFSEDDHLCYSIVFLPDYVKKEDAIKFALTIFPKLQMGMDFYSKPNDLIEAIPDLTSIQKGDELKSYNISLSNVQTGYWDLEINVKNATQESPNKLINAFNLFYKAVKYLHGESQDYISRLEIEEIN